MISVREREVAAGRGTNSMSIPFTEKSGSGPSIMFPMFPILPL